MVIGNGMIANMFKKYASVNNVVIFASGVSDSSEVKDIVFLREKSLIKSTINQHKDKQFIYFSSCSLEDEELKYTPYHMHKKKIELSIQRNSPNYIIFRLPNVIGFGGNEANIINFLINKIKNNNEFAIHKNATRNIVDIEHFYQIASYIIDNKSYRNRIINIAYDSNTSIIDLVFSIEKMLNIKSIFSTESKGSDLKIDNLEIRHIMEMLNIKQPDILTLLRKYKDKC